MVKLYLKNPNSVPKEQLEGAANKVYADWVTAGNFWDVSSIYNDNICYIAYYVANSASNNNFHNS